MNYQHKFILVLTDVASQHQLKPVNTKRLEKRDNSQI